MRKTRPANSRWKILVLDAYTKTHLNYLMTTYQALEEGVQRESRAERLDVVCFEQLSRHALREVINNPGAEAVGKAMKRRKLFALGTSYWSSEACIVALQ